MRLRVGVVLLLLAVLAPSAAAQTVLRDQGGTVLPCQWRSATTGAFNECSDQNPMPMASAGGAPATSDPNGWGRQFFTGTAAPGAGAAGVAGTWVDDTSLIAYGNPGVGNMVMWRSTNRGLSWTSLGTVSFPSNPGAPRYALLYPNGQILLMSTGTGTEAFVGAQSGPFVASTGTKPGGLGTLNSPRLQGATTIAVGSNAGGAFVCRSTNSGVSFSCAQDVTITGNISEGSHRVASPSLNVWLLIDDNRVVYRSTNDGVTWAVITTLAGGAGPSGMAIGCLDATRCLAAVPSGTGGAAFQSTDAGLTWTLVYTFPVSTLGSVVNFGSGVVVMLGAPSSTTQLGIRSTDFGATWATLGPETPTVGTNAVSRFANTDTRSGRSVIFANNLGGNTDMLYSIALGPGDVGLIGPSGVRANINNAGAIGTYQDAGNVGGAATLNPWLHAPVQGATLLAGAATVSGANAAAVRTLTGAANQRVTLRSLCIKATGAAANFTLTISDGATLVLDLGTQAAALNGPAVCFGLAGVMVTGTAGNNVVINIGAGGAGAITTTTTVADRN